MAHVDLGPAQDWSQYLHDRFDGLMVNLMVGEKGSNFGGPMLDAVQVSITEAHHHLHHTDVETLAQNWALLDVASVQPGGRVEVRTDLLQKDHHKGGLALVCLLTRKN
jgi:hypothetical protein